MSGFFSIVGAINQAWFAYLHDFFLSRSADIERAIIFGALYIPLIVAAVYLVAFFVDHDRRRRHWFLFELSGSVLVAVFLLSDNLQALFASVRPYAALHFIPAIAPVLAYSFPSSHASGLFAAAFSVRFHHKRTGNVLLFLALVNGLARVAVGVHWPIDILGGIVVGLVSALIAHAIVRFAEGTFGWTPTPAAAR